MYYYRIYGSTMKSEIALSYLIKSDNTVDYDIEVLFKKVNDDIHSLISEGKEVGFNDHEIWFRNDHGIFHIQNGCEIIIEVHQGLAVEPCIPFITGLCMAFLFEQRHKTPIHCSAVTLGNKSILISGNSGSGKTSLATAFINDGSQLISDDIAIVYHEEGVYVTDPAFPIQKLCTDLISRLGYEKSDLELTDNRKDKYAISRHDIFCLDRKEISAMIVLETEDVEQVSIQEVIGVDKLNCVLKVVFTGLMNKCYGVKADRMNQYIHIANQIPIFRIRRPKDKITTAQQMQLIKDSIL